MDGSGCEPRTAGGRGGGSLASPAFSEVLETELIYSKHRKAGIFSCSLWLSQTLSLCGSSAHGAGRLLGRRRHVKGLRCDGSRSPRYRQHGSGRPLWVQGLLHLKPRLKSLLSILGIRCGFLRLVSLSIFPRLTLIRLYGSQAFAQAWHVVAASWYTVADWPVMSPLWGSRRLRSPPSGAGPPAMPSIRIAVGSVSTAQQTLPFKGL